MFDEIPEKYVDTPMGTPQVRNYKQMLLMLNRIIQIAPALSEIREFFDETVVKKMCDGSFDMLVDNSIPAVISNDTNSGEASGQDLCVVKTIGDTDVKYNICTFGAKFHIGFGVPVTIRINDYVYSFNMHKTAKGRIDGMKKLYAENGIVLGTVLKATYNAKNQEIILEIQ